MNREEAKTVTRILGGMLLMGALLAAAPAAAQDDHAPIDFIGVTPDDDYERADQGLAEYLQRAARIGIRRMKVADYHTAIKEVVHRGESDQSYLARLTPYAYVVAEIQGAQFETLATYKSRATDDFTYSSYLVVRGDRSDYRFSATPSLREVGEFLASGSRRVFAYHDKFSTSSYFVPLHYFRSQRIFDTQAGQRAGRFFPVTVRQAEPGSGSSDLVRMVLDGRADIAAVWDGTARRFENLKDHPEYGALRFVRLDTVLPNDLLVCSKNFPEEKREALRVAIEKMDCGGGGVSFAGDFACWAGIREASDARRALAGLRRLAVAQPAPVTVSIGRGERASGPGEEARYEPYLQAARQAVKLAGTEFVLFDQDFHEWADLDWRLEIVHDGAIKLTSRVNGKYVIDGHDLAAPQVFRISFTDVSEDLTKRIVTLVHTRLNRIRYVWPFENKEPTILRDVGFAIPVGTRLAVQRITWTDPEKNEFTAGDIFAAPVTLADFHKFQLESRSFPKLPSTELDLNPMSNSAFRVVLVRPAEERAIFRYLTVALVLLCLAAAGGIVVDHLRRRPATAGALPAEGGTA